MVRLAQGQQAPVADMTNTSEPLGAPVPGWHPPPSPDFGALAGTYAQIERLDAAKHGRDLYAANSTDAKGIIWTYLPYGPFATLTDYARWVAGVAPGTDPVYFAIRDLETGRIGGVASYLRIAPQAGSLEVGHINFAPALQKTRAGTEAVFLMMQWAFEAGYRRFEWKCDALNARSCAAAVRYGLTFEGIFRQAAVVKGRNRDTAWYAAIDAEWPALREAFDIWLSDSNFTPDGAQKQSLRGLTKSALEQIRKQ